MKNKGAEKDSIKDVLLKIKNVRRPCYILKKKKQWKFLDTMHDMFRL